MLISTDTGKKICLSSTPSSCFEDDKAELESSYQKHSRERHFISVCDQRRKQARCIGAVEGVSSSYYVQYDLCIVQNDFQ